jgi:hypothetical protein
MCRADDSDEMVRADACIYHCKPADLGDWPGQRSMPLIVPCTGEEKSTLVSTGFSPRTSSVARASSPERVDVRAHLRQDIKIISATF